ncbi:DUF4765 family protein [Salmonella enterica]|nr:DUF4765 family protein [Salmonella enterica]EBO3986464.1 DUF4765 family protein [Salmonella enterica]
MREDLYVKGYHELLVFSQTGKWPQNGREIASEYIIAGGASCFNVRLLKVLPIVAP